MNYLIIDSDTLIADADEITIELEVSDDDQAAYGNSQIIATATAIAVRFASRFYASVDRPEKGSRESAKAGHLRGLRLLGCAVGAFLMLIVSLSMAHAAPAEKPQSGPVAGPAEAIKGGTLVPAGTATGVVVFKGTGSYCGGVVVWQDWDPKSKKGRAYILTAYHCVNNKIRLTPAQCTGKNTPFVSDFMVEYRHAGGGTVLASRMCRQPEDGGYGSDVLLVATEETSYHIKSSDIYPLGRHFDLTPQDYRTSGTVYGYSTLQPPVDGGPPGLALGPLRSADFYIDDMGYLLDAFGGNAVNVTSGKEDETTLMGDSGGPLIVRGVLSIGAGNTSRYSRVNSDWVQEEAGEAGTVLITAPKPFDYLKDQGPILTVEGEGPPDGKLQVQLWAGTTLYNCGRDGRVTVDLNGRWSCPLDLTELPEAAAGQKALTLWAMLDSPGSRAQDKPYDRVSLNYPVVGKVDFTRPSKTSSNYNNEDENLTVPGYQMAGTGMRGGQPVLVVQTDVAKISTLVCPGAGVTLGHTWTCPSLLKIPQDAKQYRLTAQQYGPPGGAQYGESQTDYQAFSTPAVPVRIIDPVAGSEVYTWSRLTVKGKNIDDDEYRNVVELNSPLSSDYPTSFLAETWLAFKKDSGRVHAHQFENGQSTSEDTVDYTVKETPLKIDEPRDSGKSPPYIAGKDKIPVSGRGSPGARVRVEQVDGTGTRISDGYTCPSNGNSIAVTAQETWECPSFPNHTKGTYILKATVFLGSDDEEIVTNEEVTRTFKIEANGTCSNPAGPVDQGATEAGGEGPKDGSIVASLSSSFFPNPILAPASQDLGLCTVGKVEVGPDGKWNCTLLVLEEGEQTLTVKAYDADGKFVNQSQCHFNVEENKKNKPPKNANPQLPPASPPAGAFPPPPFPPGTFFWGFIPPPISTDLTVTIDVFEWFTGGGFKGKSNIPNIHIDQNTGLWHTDRVDLPQGRKFKIQTYLCKSTTCDAESHYGDEVDVEFYTAVGIGNNDTETLTLGDDRGITGEGQPGAAVTVTRQDTGKQICQTTVKDDGTWSCGLYPSDALGSFTVTVTQTYPDFPGFLASSSSITLNVNTPDVVIIEPSAPVTTPTYVLSGTGVPDAFVSFGNTDQQDGTDQLNGTATIVDKDGKWQSPTYVTMRGGPYTVTASQSVDGQAQSKPTSWTYSVAVQYPSITSPTPNQQVPVGPRTATGKAQPFSTLMLTDGSIQQSVQSDEKGDWSSDSYIVAPGQHTLSVQQVIMGKADGSPVSVSYWVTGSIANVAITTPTLGQTISTPVYTIGGTGQPGATVTVSGPELDTHWGIPVDAGGKWSTQYAAVAGSYTATATQIINGDETNPSNSNATVSYSVAGQAVPTPVSISTPAEKAVVDATHSIEGQGQPAAIVSLEGPSDSQPCSVKVADNGTWSCGPYTLKPAPYTVIATQWIKTANGLQQAGQPLTRHYTVRKPPTPVTIVQPTQDQVVTALVYTVSGTGATGASVTVKGLGLPDRENIPVKRDGSWSTTYLAKSGTYTILATQYIDGKQVGDGVQRSYTVNASATPLTISTPEENQIVDEMPYFIKGSGQPGADVNVSNPNHGPQDAPCQTKVLDNKQWSCGPYDTKAGTYWVQARQTMVVGNKTVAVGDPATRHYSVITPPPPSPDPVTISSPAEESTVTSLPYTVSGTAQRGMTVTVTGGGPNTTLPTHSKIPVQDNGSWSTTYDTPSQADLTITATQYKGEIPISTSPSRSYHVRDDGSVKPIEITSPRNGMLVYGTWYYAIQGNGQPGTTIKAWQSGGQGQPQYVQVKDDGTWETASLFVSPPGGGGGGPECRGGIRASSANVYAEYTGLVDGHQTQAQFFVCPRM
ncbi:hypothetical protein DUT91_23130 [Phyllobacterium salinisoli]|uniref:Peptidase S1 domain-containing protein n=1 Tax=Phyllobacterium salinisoli TaxID=1899321 RepID=A0A368JWQ2_9HYPH|nr:hypothetical protein [Phyllobacterium salinisoli]RCS21579.1 hypothetical protein DUT91_23130 [Phyllobacterium salinisoli]